MFGIGHMPELILLLVLALIIFGPGKLPELGGALGKGIREFRKTSTDIQDSIMNSVHEPATPPVRQLPTTTPASSENSVSGETVARS